MRFYACERNLLNTAKFLVDLGSEFEGLPEGDAISLLKKKTVDCIQYNSKKEGLDGMIDGARIWGCYRGVCCLFTYVSSTTDPVIFEMDRGDDNRDIVVTYHSVL